MVRQVESRGGWVPLKGWAADRTTAAGRRRGGGREEGTGGLTLSELGAGGSRARGTPCLWHLDGDHTLNRTTLHAGRLLSADFRVPPRRWYDPQSRAGLTSAWYCV